VDPSHVRNQTETFVEAFASQEKDTKVHIDTIQKWRAALIKVGKISRWQVHDRLSLHFFSSFSVNMDKLEIYAK